VLSRLGNADLPDGVKPEVEPPYGPTGEIYRYTLKSRTQSLRDLTAIQDWVLDRQFKSVPGVADVNSFGGEEKDYEVSVNPALLQKYGLTSLDVFTAINRSNINVGGDVIEKNDQAYVVRGIGLINNIDEIQKDSEARLYKDQDERYGILSLSKRWDSILMWSHYSNNHKGYCIGFWEEKFRNSKLVSAGGPVMYNSDDNYPQITPLNSQDRMEKSFIETHNKAKDWQYEEEFRFLNNFYHEIPTVLDRTIQITDDFFAEIILGLQMSKENKDEIREIAKSKNIPVYEAVKVPFKFLVDRILCG
ncbi:MAG: efflux RND transporter permease subunit, partial [Sphingobacteriales bacterium]